METGNKHSSAILSLDRKTKIDFQGSEYAMQVWRGVILKLVVPTDWQVGLWATAWHLADAAWPNFAILVGGLGRPGGCVGPNVRPTHPPAPVYSGCKVLSVVGHHLLGGAFPFPLQECNGQE